MIDPIALGFSASSMHTRTGRVVSRDYCYVRVYDKSLACKIVLDRDATTLARRTLGLTCTVWVDPCGRILLTKGEGRAISAVQRRAAISIRQRRQELLDALGDFAVYRYDYKLMEDGESIMMTPKERIA